MPISHRWPLGAVFAGCLVSASLVGCDPAATDTPAPGSATENPHAAAADFGQTPAPETVAAAAEASLAPNSGRDVMLQGFHWNSWRYGNWTIVQNNAAAIANAGFTMVWLPPPSRAASAEGYLPNEWYNLDASSYGSKAQLKSAIGALHNRGVKAIADIVINHRVGTTNWGDFSNPAFSNNYAAVTRDDEWSQSSGNWDTGDGYGAARDLDHTNGSVRTQTKNWMNWLKSDVGFDGWRYDYVKGFSGGYIGEYNYATNPYFSVGELWPDITGDYYASCSGGNYHRQKLMDWIDATGASSSAFDFTTKWQLQLAVARNEYWRMGCVPGAIGWWPAKSVTFIDNHDTGPSPGPGGGQNHWAFPSNKVEQGYAYILTHPGTPTVYWPHYFDWGSDLKNKIKTLIALRAEKGITATSSITVRASDANRYAAEIGGTLAMKIEPGNWSPGGGWTLRASGSDWAVWTR